MKPRGSANSDFEFRVATNKQKSRKVSADIRRVLLDVWDPIGIRDEPRAQDEYDSYIGRIYHLLVEGAAEEKLIEYLYWVETDQMGLPGHARDSLLAVAKALKRISI